MGIRILGIIAIILNFVILSPFTLLLTIPVEPVSEKLLKIPVALIPVILSLLGIFCGVNLIRRKKLNLTVAIVKFTIIYYLLCAIFLAIAKFPIDIYLLIGFPVILNIAIFLILTRSRAQGAV